MKNEKLLKILGLIVLAILLLTWLVPGTLTNDANVLERGSVNPAGLMSLFGSFDIFMNYFWQNTVLLLLVGALYGVVNKTGAYKALTDKIVSGLKSQKVLFLIISIVVFMLIPTFTTLYFQLFILVPFFITILLGLGYNKVTALLATIGSVLIGGSVNITNSLFMQVAGITDNKYVWVKVGLLAVTAVLTILYAIKASSVKKATKKPQTEEVKDELLIVPQKREGKTKVNALPLVIMGSLLIVILILGLVPWKWAFLTNMHNSVMNYKLFKFAVFANLFGTFNPFGQWGFNELFTVLLTSTIVIGFVYRLKVREIFEGVVEGGRKFVGIGIVVLLLNLIIVLVFNSGFLATIINLIASSGNVVLMTISSIIGVPFVFDPSYIAQYNIGITSQLIGEGANMPMLAFITQLTSGITLLVAPTCAILVAGLMYLEENYVTWLKYIWKLAAVLMLAVFIAITIATLM